MKPTIGRIVHVYFGDNKGPYAAIVTDVRADSIIDAEVFGPRGTERVLDIGEEAVQERLFWRWPPREI